MKMKVAVAKSVAFDGKKKTTSTGGKKPGVAKVGIGVRDLPTEVMKQSLSGSLEGKKRGRAEPLMEERKKNQQCSALLKKVKKLMKHPAIEEINEVLDGRGESLEEQRKHQEKKLYLNRFLPKKSNPSESEKKTAKEPWSEREADQVEVSKLTVTKLARKKSHKETVHGQGSINAKPPLRPYNLKHASSRVVTSKRSVGDENDYLSSQHTTPTTDALLTPIVGAQMSPKKALRAAMLKERFADTIFKAQKTILIARGDKCDQVKIKKEKEKFETRLHKEKAKVETKTMVAEAAAKLKAEVELEKQRESARFALEKMENTAGIELNLEIVKDLDILSGFSLYHGNPLHQFGLFIKDEYLEEDNDEAILNEDVEEGKKRQREREASRIVLEKMEKSADLIELNLEIVKELDMLSGYSLSRGNPLPQLGLFMKDEYLEDDKDEEILNEELEQGEIE